MSKPDDDKDFDAPLAAAFYIIAWMLLSLHDWKLAMAWVAWGIGKAIRGDINKRKDTNETKP